MLLYPKSHTFVYILIIEIKPNYQAMKKTALLLFAAVALLSACTAEQCKCKIEVSVAGITTSTEQVIDRPSDTSCSKIKIEDIENDIVSINLSQVASIKCVNHHD